MALLLQEEYLKCCVILGQRKIYPAFNKHSLPAGPILWMKVAIVCKNSIQNTWLTNSVKKTETIQELLTYFRLQAFFSFLKPGPSTELRVKRYHLFDYSKHGRGETPISCASLQQQSACSMFPVPAQRSIVLCRG